MVATEAATALVWTNAQDAMARTMWLSVAVCAAAALIALWLIPAGRQRAVEE